MEELPHVLEEFECSICMLRLVSLQMLPCGHLYCKQCQEVLLQFDDHGCATLSCPKKCSQVTNLERDQTLDDVLQRIFAFESILENLRRQLQPDFLYCQEGHEQKLQSSHYCQACRKTSCKSCFEEHACEGNNNIKIAFDDDKKSFQPLCEEHNSLVKHVCRECNNQLICIYCKQRGHRNHDIVELDSRVKEIQRNLTAVHESNKKTILQRRQSDEELVEQFQAFREKLSEELLVRRIILINRYITHLYEEESKILQQFDDRTNSFIQTRPRKLESFTEIEKLLDDKNSIHTLAMISEQETLLQQLQDFVRELTLSVVLTDLTDDDVLGKLDFAENESNFSQEAVLSLCGNINNECTNEMILSTNLRATTKFQDEMTSTMNKYKDFSLQDLDHNTNSTKILADFKMAVAFGPKQNLLKGVVTKSHCQLLEVLLNNSSINIDETFTNGSTALMLAAQSGCSACVKVLLEHNCHVDIENNDGDTALILASDEGHSECVKLLLEHHCDIDSKNNDGDTALILATYNGHSECVKLLLEHHCDIDSKNNDGDTALILATCNGHSECVKLLLDNHCDMDIKGNDGDTALICASQEGHVECFKLLLEHNCNVDIQNQSGNTALIRASFLGNAACVELLLKHNCNVELMSNSGWTARQLANRQGNYECVSIFMKYEK